MNCPFCGFEDTKVVDSRFSEGKQRRRRLCPMCDKRFTTYESAERPTLLVNKKNNTYEAYDRTKLIQGLSFAVKKRPVSSADIIAIADEIENMCLTENRTQISTREIANFVLERLRSLDEVAYIRFASVNREFDTADKFLETIEELRAKK
ncbi:MAG: transcriptional repressor NrdR [Oscillospiraceae bacterium]|jgi:transcriptional repressor NrdR|nr:transcriptional repressor NrdR [Oscillospiraceae bacterium]MBQ4256508.1 transcriptional repressor NrdR [Oscillospiraceae bacterium]MBQ9208642.1 transcriptional repressor NrdR [Oscillospiraceae bacterium]MBR4347050.1 transcriptional repressor NrdR [Oscillospiraceae bacterium]